MICNVIKDSKFFQDTCKKNIRYATVIAYNVSCEFVANTFFVLLRPANNFLGLSLNHILPIRIHILKFLFCIF